MYIRKNKYSKKNYKGGEKNKTQKIKKTEKIVNAKDIEELGKEIIGENTKISIPKTSISLLLKLLHKKLPEEFRQIVKDNEFYMPLDDYTENREMLLYLTREILELATNATRDTKKKTVSSKIITGVIDNDEELKNLFL